MIDRSSARSINPSSIPPNGGVLESGCPSPDSSTTNYKQIPNPFNLLYSSHSRFSIVNNQRLSNLQLPSVFKIPSFGGVLRDSAKPNLRRAPDRRDGARSPSPKGSEVTEGRRPKGTLFASILTLILKESRRGSALNLSSAKPTLNSLCLPYELPKRSVGSSSTTLSLRCSRATGHRRRAPMCDTGVVRALVEFVEF